MKINKNLRPKSDFEVFAAIQKATFWAPFWAFLSIAGNQKAYRIQRFS